MAKFKPTDKKCPRCGEMIYICVMGEIPFYKKDELRCSRGGCTYFDYHPELRIKDLK